MNINIPKEVNFILETLFDAGFEAYVVGGCVRDSVLGKEPDDWDITTNALPLEVKALFRRTVDTGLQHGTITVMRGSEGYEVTTYRTDGKYSDGRHPDKVTFVPSLEEDLKRRDFTINAMAYNDRAGLIDLFGGMKDLEDGVIRCVGKAEERFTEDALRMLRAVRFAAKLGYTLDRDVYDSIKKLSGTLSVVSAERITTELIKLLTSDHPEMIKIAYETGLTAVFFPEFDKAMQTEQNHPHHMYSVGEHLVESVRISKNDRIIRLTMLLHDIAKPETLTTDKDGLTHFHGHAALGAEMAEDILRRWKLDNDTIRRVCRLIRYHDLGKGVPCTPRAVRKGVRLLEEDFPLLLEVERADVLAQSTYMREEKLETIKQYSAEYEIILKEHQCCSLKDLAVNGKDLMELGFTPGPGLGKVLGTLLDKVIEDPSLNEKAVLLKIADGMKDEI
ncbi:MAG: HD domain-containing protein [Lachnospiraceae bacterium]|nr:HD domain-containing protein [Lachnospiraceae bacterium]